MFVSMAILAFGPPFGDKFSPLSPPFGLISLDPGKQLIVLGERNRNVGNPGERPFPLFRECGFHPRNICGSHQFGLWLLLPVSLNVGR